MTNNATNGAGAVTTALENDPRYRTLMSLREQMASQIRALSSTSLSANKQAGEEMADIGSDDFVRETELAVMDGEAQRLNKIDAALKRLKDGAYGSCTDCGKEISEGRLKAKPYAGLCIDCKAAQETASGGTMPDQFPRRRQSVR